MCFIFGSLVSPKCYCNVFGFDIKKFCPGNKCVPVAFCFDDCGATDLDVALHPVGQEVKFHFCFKKAEIAVPAIRSHPNKIAKNANQCRVSPMEANTSKLKSGILEDG